MRCAICRCRATKTLYGMRVCDYHLSHGENDRPCPYCAQYQLFDPRWTYTSTGDRTPRKVLIRQVNIPNRIFLDRNGEVVLDVIHVPEPAPVGWPVKNRASAVMIGVGLQLGSTFTITQWATDWERELLDAARPTLALANKVYVLGKASIDVLGGTAGNYGALIAPLWPTIQLQAKAFDVTQHLRDQDLAPNPRTEDIDHALASRRWLKRTDADREPVWRHNYLNVLDLAMRIFQIEW